MKKFFILLLAAIILGVLVFGVAHVLFGMAVTHALILGNSVAISGLVTEYLRPTFVKWGAQHQARIDARVRRNLHRQR